MKRFVEVEMDDNFDGEVVYITPHEHSSFHPAETRSLHDLISQVPDIRSKLEDVIHLQVYGSLFNGHTEKEKQLASAILQLFKEV
jgi:hypothetical protein